MLWGDDVEALRAEAQAATEATVPVVRELLGLDAEDDLDTLRRGFDELVRPSPRAHEVVVGGVPCRSIEPAGREARATYVHLHGGGMVAGRAAMADAANVAVADAHGIAVVSVEYRLAPEHPHPAPVDDVVAVLLAVVDDACSRTRPATVVIGGESAGAYLAAAALVRLRDEHGAASLVAGADLAWGVYDWGGTPSQHGRRASTAPDLLDVAGLARSAAWYLPRATVAERRDPSVSPAWADLHGLPPAFLAVGTADHLLDDTLLLASRWAAASGGVELFVAPDLPHSFPMVACALTDRWAAARAAWWEWLVTRGDGPGASR